MKNRLGVVLVVGVLACLTSSAWAIPRLINYQGMLTDSEGVPLEGTFTMRFCLYDEETKGKQLWNPPEGEMQTVSISQGVFNVQLGSVVPLKEEAFAGDTVYLEIHIYNPHTSLWEVLSPRQRITAVVYAIRASDAETVGGLYASSFSQKGHTHSGAEITGKVPDADRLDGMDSSAFSPSGHHHDSAYVNEGQAGSIGTSMLATGAVTDEKITGPVSASKISSVGLNADTVDGFHADALRTTAASQASEKVQDATNNVWALVAALQERIARLEQAARTKEMAPPQIEANPGDNNYPWVELDAGGNAMAVWTQKTEDGHSHAWVCRYAAGSGWETPTLLTPASEDAGAYGIGVNESGQAMAVYARSEGAIGRLYAKRFQPSGGWDTAAAVSGTGGTVSSGRIVMDASGYAIAVWTEWDGARWNLWSNRYFPGSGLWGTPGLLETDNVGNAWNPHIAMTPDGIATVVWEQEYALNLRNILARRYSAGWGAAQVIDSRSETAGGVRVAASGSMAVAVWAQVDGSGAARIWASEYAGGWGPAEVVGTYPGIHLENPSVAMDPKNNVMVVWEQQDSVLKKYRTWARRYDFGLDTWQAAVMIESDTIVNNGWAQINTPIHVAMDSAGNAVVLWQRLDGSGPQHNIWVNRYTFGQGWGQAWLIENAVTEPILYRHEPHLAVNGRGEAMAMWQQSDGKNDHIHYARIEDKGWGPPLAIETDPGNAVVPIVAMDARGNAAAVWLQHDGTRNNVWMNRHSPETGWSSAGMVDWADGDAGSPQVAMDPGGNIMVVWYQTDGARFRIWARQFFPDSGGATLPAEIGAGIGHAYLPQVAMDAAGNAISVWYEWDGAAYSVYSNLYKPGTGWGTAGTIESSSQWATDPQVALSANGQALAVWRQYDSAGNRYNIWANAFMPNWDPNWWHMGGQLIETNDSGSAYAPQVAMDGQGNGMAIWHHDNGTGRMDIWATRFTSKQGWGTPQLVEHDNSGSAYFPQVAMDNEGRAMAVWYQVSGGRANIMANLYTPGLGWGSPVLLEADDTGDALNPQVAMDSSGNATVVWHQWDGSRNNIWANVYTRGMGWGKAGLIEADNLGTAVTGSVAMDSLGNAMAVWQHHDGTRNNVVAARYKR